MTLRIYQSHQHLYELAQSMVRRHDTNPMVVFLDRRNSAGAIQPSERHVRIWVEGSRGVRVGADSRATTPWERCQGGRAVGV